LGSGWMLVFFWMVLMNSVVTLLLSAVVSVFRLLKGRCLMFLGSGSKGVW